MSVTSKPVSRHSVSGHSSYEATIDDRAGDGSRDAPPFAAHARPRVRAGTPSGVRWGEMPLGLRRPLGTS
jgi:hypothetical protein